MGHGLYSEAHHTDTTLIFGKERGHRVDVRSSHDLTSMRGLQNAQDCAAEWWGEFFLNDVPARMGAVIQLRDLTEIPFHDLGKVFAAASEQLRQLRCPRSPRQGRIDAWLETRQGSGV